MTGLPSMILLGACLLGAAFFAGMETGVVSINRLRLRHLVRHHVRGAEILQRFVQDPDHLLGTTLVGTNLCHITITVLAVDLFTALLGSRHGPAAASVSTSIVILVLCEYLPKAWTAARPARRTLPFAYALHLASLLLSPVGKGLTRLAGWVFRAGNGAGGKLHPVLTRDDVLHLAAETHQHGQISIEEARMVHAVFGLQTRTCGEIMQPRSRMVYVPHSASNEEILALARRHEVNRFPVYQPDTRCFVGVLHIFDVLKDPAAAGRRAADYMQPPHFVHADTPVETVLPRMRVTGQPLLLVVDTQREVVGLVTLGDVLGEIMGATAGTPQGTPAA